MIRIFDYIGVQDFLAEAKMGEINSIDEARKFHEEYLEWVDDVSSFEEIAELYKGDMDKIKFSLKCNYIDSFLYDPRSMEEEMDGDIEDELRNEGLIGEDEEDHFEPELRVLWTCWLDEENEMEPERRQEWQALFTDIKANFRRKALWDLFKDRVTGEKSEKAIKEHRCPICGNKIFLPAISRVDNDTEICSECGQLEAAVVFGF